MSNFSLVADIGGTSARFGLVSPGRIRPERVEVLSCASYTGPAEAVRFYLSRVGVEVLDACFSVASPDRGDHIRLTNNAWEFSLQGIQAQFGWRSFKVINDFTAMALGVLHLPESGLVHVCGGEGDSTCPRLVIGPGTGLGVSGLVPIRGGWIPLSTEGGHVDFAPTTDAEVAILKFLQGRFGRVSVERILCGPGLVNLYQAHGAVSGMATPLSTPEEITAAAACGRDPLAKKVLLHFCEILGRVAGNAALTLGSLGGVYLCGGMLPRFIDVIMEGAFQAGFEDKGRMRPLLQSIPVYLVTEAHTGLLGASEALINHEVS